MMKKIKLITLIIFASFSLYGAAQDAILGETIDFIKEIGENYNYDSNGNYLSKPFKNTNAYITFNEETGILKMSNMADYSSDWGKTNFYMELNLKKINPKWVRGYTNGLNEKFSGFEIELPDDVRDNILKEDGKFVKNTGSSNFKGDTGERIAKALKHACTLLYEELSVKKFKF